MAKRSQKRPSRHERDQTGCISGLISIFDFRHGRSTRKLLADRRRVSKQGVGVGHASAQAIAPGPAEECENALDAEESKNPVADVAKTSVKELMEEEMSNEQGSKNQMNNSDLEQMDSRNGHYIKKNQRRRNRSWNKSSDMDVYEQKPSDNLDLDTITEVLAQINQRNRKRDSHDDLDIPSGAAVSVVEEKIVAAVKLLIEQRLSRSKRFGEEGNYSKEIMDALETLRLDKSSFVKTLKDPNSILVKHIRDLEDALLDKDQNRSSCPASNASEEKSIKTNTDDRKYRGFFRRRSKSLESYPSLGGVKDCQASNKIVILKPGPGGAQSPETNLQSHYMDNKIHSERSTSQFSFTEIKRKLRHAMGKEAHGISPDRLALKVSPKHQIGNNGDKGATGESWRSPNRDHFFTEKFTLSSPSFRRAELVGKSKENGSANETSQNPRVGGANIYIEAKRHLSEMLKNGDENAGSRTGQLPKSLGRILSFPEYGGSPLCSPGKLGDDIFVTAQMRLSPRGIGKNNMTVLSQENHDNNSSPSRSNLDSQPCISDGDKENSSNTNVRSPLRDDGEFSAEVQSLTKDTITPEVQGSSPIVVEIEEATESRPSEEEKNTSISAESELANDLINEDIQSRETKEINNEESAPELFNESAQSFKMDSFGEDQSLSPTTVSAPHSPVRREVEDSDCAFDKIERPSPISVLEPLFMDDDISPASSSSRSVAIEIQPRHIQFEEQSSTIDQGICTRISLEDEESAFEYVEAVLLGSGLNWDEFLSRWLALYDILDTSLFDEVELFSSRACHDQKLLFDCANEALKEVCQSYFGCFTGTSHVKQSIQPLPKGMALINEVWKQVEWHLSQNLLPHSLDQLVRRDLARSGKWVNLQPEIELISFEIGDTIFDGLLEDIVLSFVDENPIPECEFEVVPAESNAIEVTGL